MIFELAFPSALLVVKFFLKLFVYRRPDVADALKAVFVVPVDIVFIGAAFSIASILAADGVSHQLLRNWSLLLLLAFIGLAFVVTLLWQWCEALLAQKRFICLALVLSLNLSLATVSIIQSYFFLKGLVP